MSFESGVVPEGWRSAVIVPLYSGKEEMTECKHYRGISMLSVVRKIHARIVHRVSEGLFEDGQGVFRLGKGCVNQFFILKQKGGKRNKGCMSDLWVWKRCKVELIGKLWLILRMYDDGGKLLNGMELSIYSILIV